MARRLSLTAGQARLVHLAAQGLLTAPARRATRDDVRAAVARISLLQVDTIHVVARSPYLVLHARLGHYQPSWLDELVASGALFEVWAHEACIAPIEDYAIHRRVLESRRDWFVTRARRVRRRHGRAMDALLEHVRANGPVKTSDFADPRRRRSGWWDWKKEKRWLEAWFALGELMVARRENFQRVYDLAGRVHPPGAGLALPTAAEASRALVERAVRALGVTRARWIHDYFRTRPRLTVADLRPLLADGTVAEVEVRGWPEPAFVHRDHLSLAERAAAGGLRATRTALLSPFDPVVWDRARALAMFGFDYRLECYTPAARRRFGYFALPLLRRGALVGRLDAKAHRAEGRFEVRSLHLEAGAPAGAALLADLARAVAASARWHGTPEVELRRTVPTAIRRPLAALL
ncbi:MAG TPA: crosslink repair DNA glycosylase YcaQ family protein [Anaeromyxobacteraceae bacterium]|nr:crosslink repair DNA glycosylase YcaQ family protein [Anaeromyxobacteraceae bacterium]